MKLKEVSDEQFAMETGKFLDQARHAPLLVRSKKGAALVIRKIADDDMADEIILTHPAFRKSIRRARRDRAAGKSMTLQEVRQHFGP